MKTSRARSVCGDRMVTALARRLAAAAAVELARLKLVHSDRFIREELLYPTMALAVSAERWQPSAEVPLAKRRKSVVGDVARSDMKFWRRNRGENEQLEVLIEVKLFKSNRPLKSKKVHSTLTQIGTRHCGKAKTAAQPSRKRITIVMAVLVVDGTLYANHWPPFTARMPNCRCSAQLSLPVPLAYAAVNAEYSTFALVYRIPVRC